MKTAPSLIQIVENKKDVWWVYKAFNLVLNLKILNF